jgi:hypothetical protein
MNSLSILPGIFLKTWGFIKKRSYYSPFVDSAVFKDPHDDDMRAFFVWIDRPGYSVGLYSYTVELETNAGTTRQCHGIVSGVLPLEPDYTFVGLYPELRFQFVGLQNTAL